MVNKCQMIKLVRTLSIYILMIKTIENISSPQPLKTQLSRKLFSLINITRTQPRGKREWPNLGGRPYSHPLRSDFHGGAIDLTRNSYEIMIAAPQKPIQLSLHRSIFLKQNRRKITSRNDYTIHFFYQICPRS
jgi:hypothetical protein